MRRARVPWATQSVAGRQVKSDGSRLLNFYAIASEVPGESKIPAVVLSTPGYMEWLQGEPNALYEVVGMISFESPVYGDRVFCVRKPTNPVVTHHRLSEFRFDGTDIPIRAEPSEGTHRAPFGRYYDFISTHALDEGVAVRMATDGRRVLWVIGRQVFGWDCGAAGSGTEANPQGAFIAIMAPTPDDQAATLPDEEWVDIAWTDGYFILASRSGQFFHSLLNSSQFDQLDFASASAKPDGITGLAVLNRRIYVVGTHTVEQWYNAGGAQFAFARDNSYHANVGSPSVDTVFSNDFGVFFLGTDQIVYVMSGANVRRISTETVEFDLKNCDLERSRAMVYTEEGHRFYSLTVFPSDGSAAINWTYDTTTGLWHERSNTVFVTSTYFHDRNLICIENDNDIFDLRLDYGREDGNPITREAISPILHADQQRVRIHNLQIEFDLYNLGAGETVTLSYSDDARKTWTELEPLPLISGVNEFDNSLCRWRQMGQCRFGRNYRIQMTTTGRVDIFGSYCEFTVGMD